MRKIYKGPAIVLSIDSLGTYTCEEIDTGNTLRRLPSSHLKLYSERVAIIEHVKERNSYVIGFEDDSALLVEAQYSN